MRFFVSVVGGLFGVALRRRSGWLAVGDWGLVCAGELEIWRSLTLRDYVNISIKNLSRGWKFQWEMM